LRTGVVVEVETTESKTFGETAERVHAVGLQKKALRLIPDPPEASRRGFVGEMRTSLIFWGEMDES